MDLSSTELSQGNSKREKSEWPPAQSNQKRTLNRVGKPEEPVSSTKGGWKMQSSHNQEGQRGRNKQRLDRDADIRAREMQEGTIAIMQDVIPLVTKRKNEAHYNEGVTAKKEDNN